MKKITLIDGNSLMFRSYYATAYTSNLMQNKKGLYTNAIFGFCNMLNKLLSEDIEYIFVAFDAGKQTFRHQEYTEYKGTRKKLPEELRMQIPYIKQYLDILNITHLENLDYEADDLIASCAALSEKRGFEVRVITGDKDLLQLVNNNIKVCLTKKGIGELDEYNANNFFEKTNLYPNQISDYKGLVGDTSDNLPGIKGIGEKTACSLLNKYKTLENIYEHIDELKGKTKELFEASEDIARKCKFLATLEKNVDLKITEEDLHIKEPDFDKLINFYKLLEFDTFLKKIEKKKTSIDVSSNQYKIIDDVNFSFKDILNTNSYIIPEVFTSNYYNGLFLGLGIVNSNGEFFITSEVVINNSEIKKYLLSDYQKKTFDYKKLYVILKKQGLNIKNTTFDLLLASYLINPNYAADDIKIVASNFMDSNISFIQDIYKANTKQEIPNIEIYSKYAIDKCLLIKSLEDELVNKLNELEMDKLFELELSLSKVLGDMEINGLLIDINKLDEIGLTFTKKAEEIANDIYFIADGTFNINSPKQLGEVLFEKLHLPHGKKNKTGYSTNSTVLEKLAEKYVIAKNVLEYRTYTKLISTYVNGLKEVTDDSNYIHPLYKQALTTTGRLSSIEPNIQNMPIRTEEGQVIRGIFNSRFANGKILTADYSQIELRVLADMSNDPNMIEYFNSGVDFHTKTASEIYDVDVNMVTKEMRRTAKSINFGIIYGISAWGLSENIKISPLEANIFINKYFYTFKKAKEYLDNIIKNCKEDGYTKTIFNRRRYIEEITSENQTIKSFGERTAMNAPIQGSAADIIKMAMINVIKEMERLNLKSILIAQVHDELVFDVIDEEVDIMKKIIKEQMENVVELKVPLIAEVGIGNNWLEAK